ncbi:hypothetical protein P7K49_027548 [Saguinus oedipus]|uniref:Uncharacterized protein n=1 Tax=Saguinus oedipus TaxID=9490 RepID=A0ABQ9UAL5_SAGOE|nr:hypothetical protein P7K49_027548 [Saguinus oedipus]
MEEAGAGEEMVWARSPEARPVVSPTGWWESSSLADRRRNRLRATLLLPHSQALRSRLGSRQRQVSRQGRGEATGGGRRRAVSPPPARPQGRGRCHGDGTCSQKRGSAPSAPNASLPPGPRSPLASGGGRDTGGTKTPGTTTAAAAAAATGSSSPEARPLVGSCHSPGYGPSLFSTDLSPSPTPVCQPAAAAERKCAFPDPMRVRKSRVGSVLAKELLPEKTASDHWFRAQKRREPGPPNTKDLRLPTSPASLWQSRLELA